MNPTRLALALALVTLAAGCGDDDPDGAFKPIPKRARGSSPEETKVPDDAPPGHETIAILRTTQGEIAIRFLRDEAPEHVRNFVEHARSGFYDGTYFHRVSPTFMIQGGDPNTKDSDPSNDGQGGHSWKGPGTNVRAEFGDVKHVRGIVSAARGGHDIHSAGSQFFIMVADNPSLDGSYSAFGEVIQGMDVADRIAAQPCDRSGDGTGNPYVHQSIDEVRIEHWPKQKVEAARAASK